jgi:class 3 adenylate cyclase
MFVDLAGYTQKTSTSTRQNFVNMFTSYKSIVQSVFPAYQGNIVKEIGDAYLAVFESPTNAVLCGVDIQKRLAERNKDIPLRDRIHVKAAITMGEVHVTENDVYGNPVNLASRIEKITPAGKVYFTESVCTSMNKNEVPINFVGNFAFKGILHKVKIYTVLGKYEKIMSSVKRHKKKVVNFVKKLIALIGILALVLILAGIVFILVYYPDLISLKFIY